MKVKFRKVTIIGTGFMGGCIAKALKKRKLANSVWGVVRNRKREKEIKKLKIFDEVTVDLKASLEDTSLVILATPIFSILNYIRKIHLFLNKDTLVTDIGSTKAEIMKEAKRYLKDNFVGSHPLCGSEKRGVVNSIDSLFEGSICLIIPLRKNRIFRKIKEFWELLGAETVILDESTHDKIVAYTSGLPHLLSFSLTYSLPSKFFKFTAGSFKDLSRVSASASLVWADIFLSNRRFLKQAIKTFLKNLDTLSDIIEKKDRKSLLSHLKMINKKYKTLIKD